MNTSNSHFDLRNVATKSGIPLAVLLSALVIQPASSSTQDQGQTPEKVLMLAQKTEFSPAFNKALQVGIQTGSIDSALSVKGLSKTDTIALKKLSSKDLQTLNTIQKKLGVGGTKSNFGNTIF